jgi:hypothetical protein
MNNTIKKAIKQLNKIHRENRHHFAIFISYFDEESFQMRSTNYLSARADLIRAGLKNHIRMFTKEVAKQFPPKKKWWQKILDKFKIES